MGIYDCKVKTREGKDFSLEKLKGKVFLSALFSCFFAR